MTIASTPRARATGRRSVVITDVAEVYPASSRAEAAEQVARRDEIWAHRTAILTRNVAELGGTQVGEPAAYPGLFFDDPETEFPVDCIADLPPALVSTGERLSLHLAEKLLDRAGPLPKTVHICTGDAGDDVDKVGFLSSLGAGIDPELIGTAFDPLGLYGRLGRVKRPSVSRTMEASASGTVALLNAVARIEDGTGDCGVVTAGSAKLIPLPFETVQLGGGPDRSAMPFEDNASGHFGSEGAIGILVRDEAAAQADEVPILARVAGYAYGNFGSSVVNRAVVADVTLRALAAAGLDRDTPVLVDLYGRGNRIDDGAELSAMEKVREQYTALATAYLKGERHYVIGAHGLQGLIRLLQARARGESVGGLAFHPSSELLAVRSMEHLRVDPTGYDHVVFLTYSVHGSCVAVVLDLRDGAVGSRAGLPESAAA